MGHKHLRHGGGTVHILAAVHVLPLYAPGRRFPHDMLQAGAQASRSPANTFRAGSSCRVAARLSRARPGSRALPRLNITPELLGGGRTWDGRDAGEDRNVELYNQWGAAERRGVVAIAQRVAIS